MVYRIIFIVLLDLSISTHGQVCEPQNCIVNEWSDWSGCSNTCGYSGTKTRDRLILQQSSCGGKCDLNLTETTECNRKCCPQDCMYSEWTNWKFLYFSFNCSERGERYVFHRGRTIETESTCGGVSCSENLKEIKCGHLKCYRECVLGMWSFWSSCEGPCEQTGVRNRTKIIKQEPSCGADPCPPLEEQEKCIAGCCPVDCQLGEWSAWTDCNTTCGWSNRTRTRFVQALECGGQPCSEEPVSEDREECESYQNVDCVVSPWSGWGVCSVTNGFCGEGSRNRTRTVVVDPECRGNICPDLVENGVCYGPCCRQDCEVSEWKSWTYCSTSCGHGIRTREMEILVPASCNGTECPSVSVLFESQTCEVSEMIDCQLSEWTTWSACSENCGQGTMERSRRLLTPAYCGGAHCVNKTLEESTTCESFSASRDCIMSEWGDWSNCERNCNGGKQARFREVLQAQQCKGAGCPSSEEVRTCHPLCAHPEMCNQGVCGCRPGYHLVEDGFSCLPIKCVAPSIKYCPPSRREFFSCRHPSSIACKGYDFNDTCTVSCITDWFLKGPTNVITCQANRTWSHPDLFCAPPNNHPHSMKVDMTEIKENSDSRFCIYLSTEDDSYDAQFYSILHDPKKIFKVDGSKLCLTRKADFEEKPTKWNVTVRCTDIEGAFVDSTFQFEILNENDAPKSAKLTPNAIPENSMAGVHVGCFSAQDDDPNQNVSLLLVDSEHKMFASYYNGSQLCLKVSKDSNPLCTSEGGKYCVLNMEEQQVHFVTLMAQDDYSPPGISYFNLAVTLTDVNDKPESVTMEPDSIPEEVEPGIPLTALKTIDEDRDQEFQYRLIEDSSGLFSVVNGSLISSVKFDFEEDAGKEFQIKIQSDDNGSPSYRVVSTIVFTVGDVNEAPYDLHLTSSNAPIQFPDDKPKVKENAKAAIVGTIVVKDQDKGDNLEINLVDDLGGRLVIMNKMCSQVQGINTYCLGTLVTFGSFDHETEGEVNISVSVSDNGGLQTTAVWTMEILNVNDAPSDILLNEASVKEGTVVENHNNALIAVLTAADDDVDDTHSFHLLDSADGKFRIEGRQLMTSELANLDFENINTYTIRIVAKDSGKPAMSCEKFVTVRVQDENEAPRNIRLSANKVPELSEPGFVIGTLSTEDPDNSVRGVQQFVYSLEDDIRGGGQGVEVKDNQLLVKKSMLQCDGQPCKFDFEKESQVSVKVKVTDSGSPPLTFVETLTLEVIDQNDPPQDLRLVGESIVENSPPGTIIGKLTAFDEDVGQILSFTLLNYTDVFMLKGDNSLATITSLDYEVQPIYAISVKCSDDGGDPKFVESTVTVKVLDVNEPPSFVEVTEIHVPEDRKVGEVIGTVTVEDADLKEQLSFTVTRGYTDFMITNTSCFTESGQGTRCVGSLALKHPLDYEAVSTLPLTVSVQDSGGLTATHSQMISVDDVNEPPTDILLNGKSLTSLSVYEMTQNDTLAELSAHDTDLNQSHIFSLQSGDPVNFEIIGNKLTVKSSAGLNFETQNVYRLAINVTDNGLPPLSMVKAISVQIIDVNEPPETLSLDNSKIPENSRVGEFIGNFLTTDPDNVVEKVQTFTYELISNQDGRFQILENQLQVGQANSECEQTGGPGCSLNYERLSMYNVTVLVSDNGVPPQSSMFSLTVQLTDVNDRPTNMTLSGHKIQSDAVKGTHIGQLSVMDEDADQSHTFSLVSGGDGQFLVSNEGQVTKSTDQPLESGNVYDIVVQAVDSGQPQLKVTSTFQVTVLGIKAPVSVDFTSEGGVRSFPVNHPVVMENLAPGSVIGSLVGVNNGMDQNLVFSLEIKEGENPFRLENVSCSSADDLTKCTVGVKMQNILDFEKQTSVSVTAIVENKDGGKLVEMFEVVIENENEAPKDIRPSSTDLSVQENSKGQMVTMFLVSDPDAGDTHSFTLLGNPGQKFSLSTQGQLSVAKDAVIDFEKSPAIDIMVQVTDRGGLSLKKNFTVRVEDVNEKPTQISLSQNKVKEMSEPGTVIGQLTTEDEDLDQTHTYTLMDNAGGRVLLNGTTLQVAIRGDNCDERGGSSCLLDYETMNSFDVVVTTQDSGSPSLNLTVSLTIQVVDVNDPPHHLVLSVTALPEDTRVGELLGNIEVNNAEPDQEVTYSISEDQDVFVVEGNKVVLKNALDFETQSMYNLTITAQDDGTPPAQVSKTFQITVIDVNEAPFGLLITSNNINTKFPVNQPIILENSVRNVLIGQIVVQDYDTVDAVTMRTTNMQISIVNQQCVPTVKMVHCTADLRAAVVFDHETTPSLSAELTAVDRQGLSTTVQFNLTVQDTNDPPIDINAGEDTYTVDEGSRNIKITTLTASDVDSGQNHSFTIVSETQLFHVIGNELWVSHIAYLDFETKPQHVLKIRATDNGSPPLYVDKSFTVRVNNVNEAPRNIRITTNEIPEDSLPYTVVGILTAEDPDNVNKPTQTLKFSLADPDEKMFAVNQTQLMFISGALDYERVQQYTVEVMVVDNGDPSLSASKNIAIHITDANDPPTDLKLSAMEINENCEIGTVVGTLSAEDVDRGQNLTFSLSDTSNLVVEGDQIKVTGNIDFEQIALLTFKATATDDGHPPRSVSKSFSVAVRDMNDPPTSLQFVTGTLVKDFMIPESMAMGGSIGTLEGVDPDGEDKLSFVMLEDGGGVFMLSNSSKCGPTTVQYQNAKSFIGTKCSIEVRLASVLNFESESPEMTLKVQIKDKNGTSLIEKWTFNVKNTNDAPIDISIDGRQTEIPENEPSFIIGALQTTDEDEGDTFTYHVISHWELFRIRGNKLEVASPLDYEEKSQYSVTIKSTDDGGLSFSKSFIFKVLNLNEKPINISLNPKEVSNNAAVGDVGLVTVVDPDNVDPDSPVQTHNCSVGGDGLGVFTIDHGSNNLKVVSAIPVDRTDMTIIITCKDDGSPPLEYSQNISLIIKEIVTIPKEVKLINQKPVPENTDSFIVGKFQVFNMLTNKPVENEMYLYFLLDYGAPFTLEGDLLKTTQAFDFELQQSVKVAVNAMAFGSNLHGEFTIEIEDVNEAPIGIGIYGGGILKENSAEGTIIGDINTRDQEKNQIYTYTLDAIYPGLSDPGNASIYRDVFKLQNRTLTVGQPGKFLDFEKFPVFSVLVTSTDSGLPPLSYAGVIRIVLQDVNDQPGNISLSNSQVYENSLAGTEVGNLTVSDEDKKDLHSCSIATTGVPFKIKNNLTLVTGNGQIDYEKDNIFALEIECVDYGHGGPGLRVSKMFVINVTNINEPPFDIRLSSDFIKENGPVGQVVGELSAEDLDSTEIKFEVGENPYVELDGTNTVVTKTELDFEVLSQFVITVTAVDSDKGSNSTKIQIKILDVNERPTDIFISNLLVKENLEPGTELTKLSTVDPDNNQEFVYSIPDTEYFEVQGDKLLAGSRMMDYEENSSLELVINSTDSGIPPQTIQRTFVIDVEDVNEPLIDIVLEAIAPVPEDLPLRSVLSKILVDDPEETQQHVCQVLPSLVPFSVITPGNGTKELILSGVLDYETNSEYALRIKCSDGEFDLTKEISIKIKNINEEPYGMTLSGSHTVLANGTAGYSIGEVTILDPDVEQTHIISIKGPNSDFIKVKNRKLVLTGPIPLDVLKKTPPVIDLTLTATDNGEPPLSFNHTFSLPITNVQIFAAELPTISLDNQEVWEDSDIGQVVGRLYSINQTIDEDIEFKLLFNPGDLFSIKDNTYLVLVRNLTEVEGTSVIITVAVRNTETFEMETQNITIFIKRVNNCEINGKKCDENARCVKSVNSTRHDCVCEFGFSGDGYSCDSIDLCQENHMPCRNNGTCINEVNKYVCMCPEEFVGEHCQIQALSSAEDPCSTIACQNGGVCLVNGDSRVVCSCQPGWQGELCELSEDDCIGIICHGNGTCVDKFMDYTCDCSGDRTGTHCEYQPSLCQADNVCANEEVCIPLADIGKPVCANESHFVDLTFRAGTETEEKELITKITQAVLQLVKQTGGLDLSNRKRRQTESGLGVHVITVTPTEDGQSWQVKLVVYRDDGTVITKEFVYDRLSQACTYSLTSNIQDIMCQSAVFHPQTGSESSSFPVLPLAGALGGLLILVLIIVCIWKKRRSAGEENQIEKGTSKEENFDIETSSRRSSGYASISKKSSEDIMDSKTESPKDMATTL